VSDRAGSGWVVPVLTLCIATIAVSTSELVVAGLLPTIATGLSVDIPTAGMLIAGYALGVAVAGPVLSILTGQYARKQLLLFTMIVFVIANVLCALAPSFWLLLAARLLTASIHGLYFGVAMVIVTRLAPPGRQATALSLLTAGFTIANTLGVPLGTAVGNAFGWRTVFWAVAILAAVMLPVVNALVPTSHEPESAADWRAELGAVLRPSVLACYGSIAIFMVGVIAFFAYSVPFLTQTSGVPEGLIPWVLLGSGIASLGSNLIGGRLGDWRPVPAMIGALVLATLLYLALAAVSDNALLASLALWCIWLVGFAYVGPIQTRILIDTKDAPNLASALISTAFNLGIAIGAGVGGAALAGGLDYAHLPWISAGCMVLALSGPILLLTVLRRPAMAAS